MAYEFRAVHTKEQFEASILWQLHEIECDLSPENLFCDGEISQARGRARGRALIKRQRALILLLGRKPSLNEVYDAKRPA